MLLKTYCVVVDSQNKKVTKTYMYSMDRILCCEEVCWVHLLSLPTPCVIHPLPHVVDSM